MFKTKCAFAALICITAACGSTPPAPTSPTTISSLSVIVSGLERYASALQAPMTVQLAATLKRADGSTVDCTPTATWSSSDERLLKPAGAVPGEFLVVDAGDPTASADCGGSTGALAVHITRPAKWSITGLVTDGPGGNGVTGAMLTLGSMAPVASALGGQFSLPDVDASVQPLSIAAPGFQTRETYLLNSDLRSLSLDLLGGNLLSLYRQMARNGYEAPSRITTEPTRRWTENPNIYVWTTWRDTGAPVANVDFYLQEITRVIPQLTGGTLRAGLIETGASERPSTFGWINVVFDHAGNNAFVGANPGRVQLAGDGRCNFQAVTHEFGHAMGYWHNHVVPSVMGGGLGTCSPSDLTADEARVARAMYGRAPGNIEPDRDPDASSALRVSSAAPAVAYCDRVIR